MHRIRNMLIKMVLNHGSGLSENEHQHREFTGVGRSRKSVIYTFRTSGTVYGMVVHARMCFPPPGGRSDLL